jgi:general secretion pathway protein G
MSVPPLAPPQKTPNLPLPVGGMTLVEVLAVVVILGLVAGTLLVGFSGSFGKAKHELAKSAIGVIVAKLETYKIETGGWPSNELGLAALSDGQAPPTASFYLSPDKLRDPWGKPYLYVTPGPDGHPYEILSYGADGQSGGASAGEDADISSINLRGTTH